MTTGPWLNNLPGSGVTSSITGSGSSSVNVCVGLVVVRPNWSVASTLKFFWPFEESANVVVAVPFEVTVSVPIVLPWPSRNSTVIESPPNLPNDVSATSTSSVGFGSEIVPVGLKLVSVGASFSTRTASFVPVVVSVRVAVPVPSDVPLPSTVPPGVTTPSSAFDVTCRSVNV